MKKKIMRFWPWFYVCKEFFCKCDVPWEKGYTHFDL